MRYAFHGCVIDSQTVELTRDGLNVGVEPLVFKLLLFLIEHHERVISKDELFDTIWAGKVVSDATLSNAVKLARQAVGDTGESQKAIRTVRGHGYRFVAPLAPEPVEKDNRVRLVLQQPPAFPVIPDKPSLALLKLEDLGGHAGAQVLAEGLAVDLHARLARLHGLFVIARESANQFSIKQLPMREIGQYLGVRYLVYGSTQRSERRIRVTINLAEAETQRMIWSEHLDRVVDDVFAVQDDIVNALISALLPELERAEMERARLLPTENLDAWECYHRAMWHNFRFTADDSDQAEALLLRSTQLDPMFSRAFAGLSFNHFLHAFLDTDSRPEEHARLSLEFAEKSVGLDDRDAMGHWVLGRALFLSRAHEQALRSLDRALLANPNYAQGRYARGFVKNYAGAAENALEDLDSAQRLSPFDPLLFAMKSSRGVTLALQGDREAACRWAVEATEEANAHFHIHAIAAACLQMVGKTQEARQMVARVLAMHKRYSIAVYDRSFPHHDPKQKKLFCDAMLAAGLPLN